MSGSRRCDEMMKNRKSGTTMIETLVAFLVVVLITAMFSKVVSVSVHMLNSSRKVLANTEKFNEQYYKYENLNNMKTSSMDLYLEIDKEQATVLNGASYVELNLSRESGLKYNVNDWGTGFVMYTFEVPEASTGK